MTDWDRYYMKSPTDINAVYPTTAAMMEALEDAALDRRITAIARVITGLIVLVGIAIAYNFYPEWL